MSEVRIPLSIHCLEGNASRYLQECVYTNYVSSVGSFVARFETECAGYVRSPDVVVGMHSTAMEAAHFAGRRVVQVVGTEPTIIDFDILGACKASTAEEIANCLTDTIHDVVSSPTRVHSAADVVLRIVGKVEPWRQ